MLSLAVTLVALNAVAAIALAVLRDVILRLDERRANREDAWITDRVAALERKQRELEASIGLGRSRR